ncbi:hypothetical protein [Pseudomonas aeruginosa]
MDIGTLRGLGKKSFDEATMLPFADDPEAKKHVEQASRSNKE